MIRNYYGPPIAPKLSRRTRFFTFLAFFAGLCALVPEIGLFDLTFIPLSAAIQIWTVFAVVSFVIHMRLFRTRYSAFNATWLSALYGYASAGLPLYIFMATNYYCANNKTTQQTFAVISTDNGRTGPGKCLPPSIILTNHGLDKQLSYTCGTLVDRYKTVTLPIRKGLLGFDIVYQDNAIGGFINP